MKKHMLILPVFLVAVVALILGAAVPGVQAQDEDPECFFNIELNASDLDVGVRGFFDYEPYDGLTITGPTALDTSCRTRLIADVDALSSLADQGYAEWFFESGEPTLATLPFRDTDTPSTCPPADPPGPDGFLDRFPEGDYVFDANAIDEGPVDCTALFTHVIPCAPEISASGNRGLGVTISWEHVTEVVDPELTDAAIEANGEDVEVVCVSPGNLGQSLEIVGWEVIVETEVEVEENGNGNGNGNGEVKTYIYEIDLPADARSVKVPPEFIDLGEEFQFEVLAIEESGNQTITEEDFCINERNGHVVECPEDNGD